MVPFLEFSERIKQFLIMSVLYIILHFFPSTGKENKSVSMTFIFIGPESDHWQCLSVTDWLTHSCLVNLIDLTLECEDVNSKLVEVVTVADVDAEDYVGNSLLIWDLSFGHKAKLLFRLWAQGLVKILKLKLRQDLKLEFGQFFLLMFCRGYEDYV